MKNIQFIHFDAFALLVTMETILQQNALGYRNKISWYKLRIELKNADGNTL